MNKKIVFINQATGYLTIDTINEFTKSFDNVALITGSIRVQDDELDTKVKISKIVKYNRGSSIKKALSWLIGTVQILFLLLFKYRDYERVFYSIPPTAYLLPLSHVKRFSIIIYDLYPEALKINGIDDGNLIYKWWVKRNAKVFPKAHKIYTLSEEMKKGVLNYSPNSKVSVIANWSAFSGHKPITKGNNKIVTREGLHSKFIVQYSGNIGTTHNVETIVELAELLQNEKDILFQIIGRGVRTQNIAKEISEKNLLNCSLLPFRADEELYESLCASDISIVTLDDRTADVSIPSKTYNLMAAGIPILAIAKENSGVAKIVSNYNIGVSFEKHQLGKMKDFILKAKKDPNYRQAMAQNAQKASMDFSRINATEYLNCYKRNS